MNEKEEKFFLESNAERTLGIYRTAAGSHASPVLSVDGVEFLILVKQAGHIN